MATAVIMPKFEMAQETGTLIAWLKQEGDVVEKGDPLLEVETDKATMEVEAPASGILRAVSAAAGEIIPIGRPIAYLVNPNEEWSPPTKDFKGKKEPGSGQPKAATKATPVARRIAHEHGLDLEAAPIPGNGDRITKADVHAYLESRLHDMTGAAARAVPAARRLARELGVELEAVSGSGPQGRRQSEDVRRYAAQQRSEAPLADILVRRRVPLSKMRRTIARRMTASFQEVPQFDVSLSVDMARARVVIDDLNSGGDAPPLTLTAFLLKCCAWALTQHPNVNASYSNDEIIEWAEINLGVAVAVEDGLIVPVVRQVDRKGLRDLAIELNDLVARARSGRLQASELNGGTFTISNLGMLGIDRFTAIVNPPEAAILAVGRVRKQAHVTEDDQVVVRTQATLSLTADHRLLDGAIAARFLATLQRVIEHPGLLLS